MKLKQTTFSGCGDQRMMSVTHDNLETVQTTINTYIARGFQVGYVRPGTKEINCLVSPSGSITIVFEVIEG